MKCPKCGHEPMGKAGYAISGYKKVQRWRCSICLTTTTKEQVNTK